MEEIFSVETWRRAFGDSMDKLAANIGEFLPKLLATVVIVLIGWVLARLAEFVALRALRIVGFDGLAKRVGFASVMSKAGITAGASQVLSRLVFWLLILVVVLSGLEALGFQAVTETVDRFIGYLPNLLSAAVIVLLAVLSARLVRRVLASGAAAINWAHAARLGAAASSLVLLIGSVLALAQLGVDTEILVSVVTVLVGALSLTLGVAFALGASPVVTHILAGHFLRQSLPTGGYVEVEGRRGELERVGPVDTLLRDEEGVWSIPNRRLLDEIVKR